MADYNTGGFSQGDDGAVYGSAGSTGKASDYDGWDWKQIMAAINGGAAMAATSDTSRAAAVADPNSLVNAGNDFYRAQLVLEMVAKSLDDQSKALAGEDGPWRGEAAQSFRMAMRTFSTQVDAVAGVLSGGSAGIDSIPNQLVANGNQLARAQARIRDIDAWYAQEAQRLGVTAMGNGLIPVSKKPEIVRLMNRDMREVLTSLAGQYQITIDAVRTPPPVQPPVKAPGASDRPVPPAIGPGAGSVPSPAPFPGGSAPRVADFPGGTGAAPPPVPGLPGTAGGGMPAAFPGGGAVPAPAAFPGGGAMPGMPQLDGGAGRPRAFPGLPGGAGTWGLPALDGPGGGAPVPFPGGAMPTAGRPPGIGAPLPFPGGTGADEPGAGGVGRGVPGMGIPGAAVPLPFPGSTGGVGTGRGLPGIGSGGGRGLPGIGGGSPLSFPGPSTPGAGASLPSLGSAGLPSEGSLARPFPGSTGVGGPIGSGVATPGLGGLDAAGRPYAVDAPSSTLGSVPGATTTGAAPAAAETAVAGGAQSPMMPMAPMMPGGAPGGAKDGERSDASGLLTPDERPWTDAGATHAEDEIGAPEGTPAAAGRAAVRPGLAQADVPATGVATGGAVDAAAAPADGAGIAAEPLDALGLLENGAAPWSATDGTVAATEGATAPEAGAAASETSAAEAASGTTAAAAAPGERAAVHVGTGSDTTAHAGAAGASTGTAPDAQPGAAPATGTALGTAAGAATGPGGSTMGSQAGAGAAGDATVSQRAVAAAGEPAVPVAVAVHPVAVPAAAPAGPSLSTPAPPAAGTVAPASSATGGAAASAHAVGQPVSSGSSAPASPVGGIQPVAAPAVTGATATASSSHAPSRTAATGVQSAPAGAFAPGATSGVSGHGTTSATPAGPATELRRGGVPDGTTPGPVGVEASAGGDGSHPAEPRRPHRTAEPASLEEVAAWDAAASSSLVPLLWRSLGGRGRAEPRTGESADTAPDDDAPAADDRAADAEPDGPTLTSWRPSPVCAAEGPAPDHSPRSGHWDPNGEEADEDDPSEASGGGDAPGADRAEEPEGSRIAELLAGSTTQWGSWDEDADGIPD
ncbi:hypothetical protein OG871_38150 [Kitasatospora sp. NBC_00374]|uniref:WXG100 family type VII secretion target n=1 Tax=Kitasatospora sp. NBC_00374 TaxID=2975964 RepID=UPI003253E6ED